MSNTHFTQDLRNELSVLLRANIPKTDIARLIGKSRTSIYEEITNNGEPDGNYHAGKAHRRAWERRKEAKAHYWKIENNPHLKRYICARIKYSHWSPEQIAGRIQSIKCPPSLQDGTISHECIYQWIYQKRPELKECLRCKKGK